MGKLQNFWNENTPNKIIAIVGLSIILVCICAICIIIAISGWLIFEDRSLDETLAIPATPPMAIAPTDIPAQNSTDFLISYVEYYEQYASLFDQLAAEGEKYDNDKSVFSNPGWQQSLRKTLDEVDALTNQMKDIAYPSADFLELQKLTLEFAEENESFTKFFRLWLDTGDDQHEDTAIEVGNQLIETLNALEAEALRLLNR